MEVNQPKTIFEQNEELYRELIAYFESESVKICSLKHIYPIYYLKSIERDTSISASSLRIKEAPEVIETGTKEPHFYWEWMRDTKWGKKV